MTNPINQHFIEMAAIGRQFHLGDLYDYQTDRIIKGRCWEQSDVASTTLVDLEFKLELILPNPESNKWEQMGLDEHIKSSTVAGIVDKYRGASTFLNERKNPAQITQTVVCRVKSKKERLDLVTLINQDVTNTGRKDKQQNKSNEATHVVVAIDYGAYIYCVLTKDLVDETDQDAREDAKIGLASLAEKMESALKECRGSIAFAELFNQEEKKKLTRMKCRLYLDVQTPTFVGCNYFVAYKNCLKLIEKIRKVNGNSKVVPIFLELCPLNVIKNTTGVIPKPFGYREVEAELIERFCYIKVELETIIVKAEMLLKPTAIKWHRNSLRDFTIQIEKFWDFVIKSLKDNIIRVRTDGHDNSVKKVIQRVEDHSIFKLSRLKKWLHLKSTEIEMTEKITKYDGLVFLTTNELQKEITGSKYTLVLKVPVIETATNEILKTMKDYFEIYTKLVAGDEEDDAEEENNLPWHMVLWKQNQVLDKVEKFSDFVLKNKLIRNEVKYFVTQQTTNDPIFECQYSIYESEGFSKNINQLPGPPTDLQVYIIPTKNFFRLEWNYEVLNYPIHHFIIQYRSKNVSNLWILQRTVKSSQHYITINCKSDVVFEFRVAAETCVGRSEFSDIIDTEMIGNYESKRDSIHSKPPKLPPVYQESLVSCQRSESDKLFQVKEPFSDNFLKTTLQPPVDLVVKAVTKTTAELTWSLPNNDDAKSRLQLTYQVCYYPCDQDPSLAKKLNVGFETSCRLEQIETDTSYKIQVVALSDDGRMSAPSRVINITTLKHDRFTEEILKYCYKNGNRNGLDLYTVPLTKLNGAQTAERFICGRPDKRSSEQVQHKTILLVGATGTGKSALINGMINYIFGVEWEDSFRFQLIEEQVDGLSEIDSKTNKIIAYDIHHIEGFSIPFSLTIVDTPGFGDIQGLDRDQEITEMLRQFFEDKHGIQELDVIGFVAQASIPRLTPTQMCTFDSILSMFGNDVKENINLLLTFADSQLPPMLRAIDEAGLPFPIDDNREVNHYKFNNSGFFCSNQESFGSVDTVEKFNRFFWRMGMENFQRFFSSLSTIKTNSLSLTKQVLEEKKKFEIGVDEIKPLIKNGLTKMKMLRDIKETGEIRIGQDVVISKALQKSRNALIERVENLTTCIQLLEEIALRPNPFSSSQYVNLIIEAEQREKRTGFKERIHSLKNARQIAVIINSVQNKESTLTLLDQIDDLENQQFNQESDDDSDTNS